MMDLKNKNVDELKITDETKVDEIKEVVHCVSQTCDTKVSEFENNSEAKTTNEKGISSHEVKESEMRYVTQVETKELRDLELSFEKIQSLFSSEMNSIKTTANDIVPLMIDKDKKTEENIKNLLSKINKKLNENAELDEEDSIQVLKDFFKEIKNIKVENSSKVIIKSLFLNVFSEFDSFLNNLLRHIFMNKANLIKSSEKVFSVHEIMEYNSIDDFKNQVIDKEIDSLIRKSYIEQFNHYEKKFNIKTLKSFPNWGKFVEITQRRNIIMHCDGKVTAQYYEHCCNHNCLPGEVSINDRLDLTYEYLIDAITIVNEVGNKLLHVLWRKQFPDEHIIANRNLQNYLYNLLELKDFELAKVMGEFSCNLKSYSEKIDEYFFVVNYAIALKQLGLTSELDLLISKYDWSSVQNEFKLAKYILMDEEEKIEEIMVRIGSNSDLFSKKNYLTFPIFEFINEKEYFRDAFSNVFELDYETQLIEMKIMSGENL